MKNPTMVRLLIVDDEAAQMQALCDTLEDQGFEVTGRGDGAAALEALRQSRFDLLLADLMMPGMNGIELLRAAFAIDAGLVGIIMTGEGTIGSAVEAMKAGASDYILKPFRLGAVITVLERALVVRRLRQQNAELERRLREHAAELEATNRELEAFTRSASHDLRTPLNAVLGFSTLLLGSADGHLSLEERSWLQQIQQAAQRMTDLTEALMRLSRAGRHALQLQPVEVGALVRAVAEELRAASAVHRVAVDVGELPSVNADPTLLRQVFVNLLSNAFKYTRHADSPRVEVRFERRGGEGVFSVRDNGSGFDAGRAERLFHAFQRFHRDDEFEGSGVGLSIVERIVQRHGGRLWAESAPGQGAAFFFTLAPG